MDAAKLDGLAGLVDEVDAGAGPTPEQAQAQTEADQRAAQAAEWAALAQLVGGALALLAPELTHIYTPAACERWGASVVPVAEKYGWNGPNSIPEIGLAIATAGLAVPSFILIRQNLAKLRATREANEKAGRLKAQAKAGGGAEAIAPGPAVDTSGAADGG